MMMNIRDFIRNTSYFYLDKRKLQIVPNRGVSVYNTDEPLRKESVCYVDFQGISEIYRITLTK